MTASAGFIELTDDAGHALTVRRDEIAAVRSCSPAIAYMSSSVILKCGETIALKTEFSTVVERLRE